jgi:hypothetical protein
MTLLQAIGNAEKAGLRISHPKLNGGELMSLALVQTIQLSALVAISNEWELEARKVTLDEHNAKARITPVLRKYIAGGKVDELAEAIVAEFFAEHT